MKIKRKRQNWRRWGRLLLGDVLTLGCLIFFCNVPCGLVRMSDDGMSPSVREGDLLVISKIDQEIRTDDIVLACLESCRVMRVIASNDIVEVRDDVLVVNQEESRKLLEGDASKVID